MQIEMLGTPRDIWIMCPHCNDLFYIEGVFYEPRYDHLLLHCPFCHKDFDKKDAPRTWGRR